MKKETLINALLVFLVIVLFTFYFFLTDQKLKIV